MDGKIKELAKFNQINSMPPINTAICSFGMSGWVFHAPFLTTNPGFNFYGVWERTKNLAQEKYPGVKTSLLIEPAEMISLNGKIKELGFSPDVVSPEYHMVSASIVNEMHKEKMKIIPWTVNDVTSINGLKSMVVDGIISDYPDLLQ